jgi:hypothetical protein
MLLFIVVGLNLPVLQQATKLAAEGMLATESMWHSYVYALRKLLLLNNPLLTVLPLCSVIWSDCGCRSKLLVIMGIRLWHLAQVIPSGQLLEVMGNGVPLYVSVGVLRSTRHWSVYFMWQEMEHKTKKLVFKWLQLLDGLSLATPEGFLHYTTFMWCLSVC